MDAETAALLRFEQEQLERLSTLVRTLLEMSDLQSVPRTDCIDLCADGRGSAGRSDTAGAEKTASRSRRQAKMCSSPAAMCCCIGCCST